MSREKPRELVGEEPVLEEEVERGIGMLTSTIQGLQGIDVRVDPTEMEIVRVKSKKEFIRKGVGAVLETVSKIYESEGLS